MECEVSKNIYYYDQRAFTYVVLVSCWVQQIIFLHSDFGFQRILSEVYDTKSGIHTSSYYAVAVVKADSNITSFSHLEGRKSCHTGIGKTAGKKIYLEIEL